MAAQTLPLAATDHPFFWSRIGDARRYIMIIAADHHPLMIDHRVGGRRENTDQPMIVASFIATTLAVATPLTLGALSGIFCERAGVVNIAIEGMMLGAAFFGFIASIYSKQAGRCRMRRRCAIGVIVAMLTGCLFALLHAVLSITLQGESDHQRHGD